MPLPTRDEFIDCLKNSGLLEEERLQRFLRDVAAGLPDPEQIGKALIEAGLITAWQRDRLLEKRWKGFFLGKYKILSPIGAGAMGSVFLAEHKVMRHRVALKVLAKRLVSKPTNVTRFEREARAAAVVNHPNVVRAYDIDRDGDTHYLVMEFVQGENLQKYVQEQGVMLPKVAANYIAQVARGLHEAHKNGLVHRDIKPANLLLDDQGMIKILDLGLARIQDDEASITIQNENRLLGTVDYLAPEQAINSHTIDGRADLYSLGCTLYYLLTGFPPFPSGSLTERILKHQTKRPLDIRKRRPDVPEALVNICNRLMEKQPDRRFQNGGEAADALDAFCADRYTDSGPLDDLPPESTEDVALASLQEDSSPGRSTASGMRSSTGRSTPSMNGQSAARSQVDVRSAPVPAVPVPPAPATKMAAAAPVARSTSNAGNELELDLSPLDEAEAKKAAAPAAKSTSGSRAGQSAAASVLESAKKKRVAVEASKSMVDLDFSPAPLSPSTDQSIFDGALEAPSPLSAPLAAAGPLVEKAAAPAEPAGPPSIFATVTNLDPLASSASNPLDDAGHHGSSPASQLLARAAAQSEEEEAGFNYPLWILVGSGLFLSMIVVVVLISYVNSFKKDRLSETNREEQNNKVFVPSKVRSSRE